jgi:hypothetical protein
MEDTMIIPQDFEKYTVPTKPLSDGGYRAVLRFPNGYGASIIRRPGSYGADQGLYEMAVVKFHGLKYELCYDTPIADDVIGWMGPDEIRDYLERIIKLPKP